jgi:hypothetical protein
MAEDVHYCPLHECVFSGDVRRLSGLLRLHDVTKKDKHGMFVTKFQWVNRHQCNITEIGGPFYLVPYELICVICTVHQILLGSN